jgi:hypothetical protein
MKGNKKFQEEMTANISSTTIWVFDTTNRNFYYVCVVKKENTILEAAVLELLMWRIYEVSRWDSFMLHDIHIKFHEDWNRR